MLNIALTGNVAAGKSTVVRWFEEWGATIIDSDSLVAEAQRPGTKTLADLVRRFGASILAPDGTLDRDVLRKMVLDDSIALDSLNAIVHPAVRTRREELIAQARHRGDLIVVNDIPLLFEVMDPATFDLVVLVESPEAARRTRILGRGLTTRETERLMATQMPSDQKRARAHIIIDNGGSLDDLRTAAEEAWRQICLLADA